MDMLKDLKIGTSCKPMYIKIADGFSKNIKQSKIIQNPLIIKIQ
jgi:hypothetical protein